MIKVRGLSPQATAERLRVPPVCGTYPYSLSRSKAGVLPTSNDCSCFYLRAFSCARNAKYHGGESAVPVLAACQKCQCKVLQYSQANHGCGHRLRSIHGRRGGVGHCANIVVEPCLSLICHHCAQAGVGSGYSIFTDGVSTW